METRLDNLSQQRTVMERALVGGGCFWCTEGAYKRMKGIVSALPAYAGGPDKIPITNLYVQERQVMQKLSR